MPFQSKDRLTFARQFLEPVNSNHRLYEALCAYFVEQRPAAEVAQQFGYTAASLRVMAHEFRKNPERDFFLPSGREIRPDSKRKRLRESIVKLRKQNLAIDDISRTLSRKDQPVSAATVSTILAEEGFARLPRRADEERPEQVRPETAEAADVVRWTCPRASSARSSGGCFCLFRCWSKSTRGPSCAKPDCPAPTNLLT